MPIFGFVMPRRKARNTKLISGMGMGLRSDSRYFDASSKDTETVWRFILAVLQKDTSDPVMASLSAGPLEDLLAKEGNAFIERVELQARQDPNFRHLLGGVLEERHD